MKYLLGIIIFVVTINVNAGDYIGGGTIKTMQSRPDGWTMNSNGQNRNPDGCSKDVLTKLNSNHPRYNEIYSLLLSAYTAGKDVNIYVDGCDAKGYKQLSYVWSNWN